MTNIKIQAVGDTHHIEAEALSASYLLDIKRNSRSFQEQTMTYLDMIKEVLADYQDADVIDTASNDNPLKDFTLQYQETDWQFLKRMASRFHTGLIPASQFDSPKVFFGIPKGKDKGNLEEYHYTAQKNIARFHSASQNDIPELEQYDYSEYEIQSEQIMQIGDKLLFQNKPLYVSAVTTHMQKGILKHTYTLTGQSGLKQRTLYNNNITGLSIPGKVLDVTRDTIKAQLEIDPQQDQAKAYWFPYSTIYASADNSGWYCMPELGDSVRIYFPNHQEKDCVALSSVSIDKPNPNAQAAPGDPLEGGALANRDRLGDPGIKSLSTQYGKEIILAPDRIIITGDGVCITLRDGQGIEITTNQDINIKADENIILDSQKVIVKAQEEINLDCQGHTINMADTVDIGGPEVKIN